MANQMGRFLLICELCLGEMRKIYQNILFGLEKLFLPESIRDRLFVQKTKKFFTAVHEIDESKMPHRVFWKQKFNSPAIQKTITLDKKTRQTLLQIIKALQDGYLNWRDKLRTNMEIFITIFNHLGYMAMWDENSQIDPPDKYCKEELDRFAKIFQNNGLMAIFEAQLAFWETVGRVHIYSGPIDFQINNFLVRWARLARFLNVTDDHRSDHEQRITALIQRSNI